MSLITKLALCIEQFLHTFVAFTSTLTFISRFHGTATILDLTVFSRFPRVLRQFRGS